MSFDGFYISIHSLRMEGDISIKNMTANYPYFNPLPPYGGRHPRMRLRRMPETFQSTPSVWRETVLQVVGQSTGHHFNPLPPYGGRHQSAHSGRQQLPISIHSLRMEGDALLLGGFLENFTFQSTPSVWRETSRRRTFPDSQQRISIHSLRMEGDFVLFEVHHITCYFNPLPPYGGRRLIRYPFSRIHAFQSTPSVWRETL